MPKIKKSKVDTVVVNVSGDGRKEILTRYGTSLPPLHKVIRTRYGTSRPFESRKHVGSGERPSSGKLFMDQPESVERLRWYAHPNWNSVIPSGDVTIIDQGTSWTDPWVVYATPVGSSVLIGLARPLGAGTPCNGLLISVNGMKRLAAMKKA